MNTRASGGSALSSTPEPRSSVSGSRAERARRREIVRAPNHLGDLVMALPALEAAPEADVLVAAPLAPLLGLIPGFGGRKVIALRRGRRGLFEAAHAVRAGRYDRGVLLTPSFSAALVFALGRVRARRGTATDGRSLLLTDPVPAESLAGLHRCAAYAALVTGRAPSPAPVPRIGVPAVLRDRWRDLLGADAGSLVGVFPGGNASSRRWDADRYAEVVRRLAARGHRVVVFGGPAERELAARVAGADAVNVAGRTDLGLLAAGLAACDFLVTNDTGPMHLAAAVGTTTISFQGASDPVETGPRGAGHVLLRRPELPCVPCVKNECPRRGRGYVLPEAERECLRLIGVEEVMAAVEAVGETAGRER